MSSVSGSRICTRESRRTRPQVLWLVNVIFDDPRKEGYPTMRKLLLLAVAASTLAVVGTAAAVKPGVSITASKSTVVYGGTVKLSGVVASHQAGTEVRVLERAYGATTFSQVASVNTTTGGEWSYTASAALLSRYEAPVGGNAAGRG